MTQWSELEDIVTEEEFDEYDPLAPMVTTDDPTAAELETDQLSDPLDSGPWSPDKGFQDGAQVLRVFVDEDKHIVKVRMSPNWRERITKVNPKASEAEGLSKAFRTTFIQIAVLDAGSVDQSDEELDNDREAKEPLTWDAINKTIQASRSVAEQLDALGDGGFGQFQGQETVGTAEGNKVRLTLGVRGFAENVEFDPAWLDESRVKQVCDAVVAAYANARERFVPPTYVPGERDGLLEQQRDLRNEMLAMMRRGFE